MHVPALFLSEHSAGCVLPPPLALVSTEHFWTPNGWETLPWQPAALNHTGWDNSAEHFTSSQSHLASPCFFKEGSGLWCSTINHHGQEISFWIPQYNLKLWIVYGLLANTKRTLRNWRVLFPLKVVWKGADCSWTVCRSSSSAAVICLVSSSLQAQWCPTRQEGDVVWRGWGKWNKVFKLLAV